MIKLNLLGIICFCFLQNIWSQNLYFEGITTKNGLSNNKVNCILQDRRGFIWIGTNDGLNRYDGNKFMVFRNKPNDTTSLSGNYISDLLEDKDGNIWIATLDGGITRYNYMHTPQTQFKQFKHQPNDASSIPVNIINAMIEDQQGYLWLATGGFDVIRLHKSSGKISFPFPDSRRTALDLCLDKSNTIWIGRQGGGIVKINPVTLAAEKDIRYDNLYASLPHAVVTTLFCDEKNNMWYGSWDKLLYQYNRSANQEKSFPGKNEPNSFIQDQIQYILADRDQRLWLGGKDNGLQIYHTGTNQFTQYKHDPLLEGSLADNNVNCIFIDRENKIWIGTNKGISVTNPKQQFFQQFISAGDKKVAKIYDFYKDADGKLWIGTDIGLFIEENGTTKYFPLYDGKEALAVTSFYPANKNVFYIGTNSSLFILDKKNKKIQKLPNTENDKVMNHLIASRVVSMAEDSIENQPVLMVSPYGHFLAYYNFIEHKWVSRLDTVKKILARFNLKDNLIRKMYKTSSGNIWFANVKEGLGKWNKGVSPALYFYKNNPMLKNSISNNNVFDIVEGKSPNLWISTYGGGLNYFEPQKESFQHIAVSDNLLEGITTDSLGNIWMISNGNLQKYELTRNAITVYALPDVEKSGGVSGYIYKDPSGKIYLAGKNYYFSFFPGEIKSSFTQPEVHLTDLKIFNNSFSHLLFQEKITLQYRQNYFTIEFAAPDFNSTQPVQYAYMLEGFDKDWVNAGSRNFASYSNLEGGTYYFKVKASNHAGVWSDKIKTIKIVIIPPVWKRWWFLVLSALLLVAAIYALYRYRINEILKRQAIRNKIAQDLHDNVGSTLSSISVYSHVAQINNSKDNKTGLNEVLEKISSTSSDMIAEMNDTVWAINPVNDNMEKIIGRMESFAKPLLAARNIKFAFHYQPGIEQINLGMEKRKNFYLIFKECLNNVIKYSGAGFVEVHLLLKDKKLVLWIQDNGVGFNVEKEMAGKKLTLSGNGLRNMHLRAKEMKAILAITSEIGKGTNVSLTCPIP